MTTRTESAEWPSAPVPMPVRRKGTLDQFFSLMDDSSKEAAQQLGGRTSVPNATLVSSGGSFHGSADISSSRAKAWELFQTKYHQVQKVYSATQDGSDLLMVGNAVMLLKNGSQVEGNFIGRAVTAGVDTQDPKLSFFQAWGVRQSRPAKIPNLAK